MTCAACAKGLEASFRNMAGVVKADVDYKAGQAVITFDAANKARTVFPSSSRSAAIR